MSSLSRHELQPFDDWTSNGPDNSLVLHDPYAGTPITPNMPPAWVTSDRVLDNAYERMMTEIGPSGFVVGAWYAGDEARADSLGRYPDVRDYENMDEDAELPFEVELAGSQAVGYVADSVQHSSRYARLVVPYNTDPALLQTGNGFVDRIANASNINNVTRFNFGLEPNPDEGGYAEQKLAQWRSMLDAIDVVHGPDSEDVVAAQVNYENAAEWIRVLRAGSFITQIADMFATEYDMQLGSTLLIAPKHMDDMSRKLRMVGVQEVAQFGVPDSEADDWTQFSTVVKGLGHIPYDMRHQDS
jgi:hypothetical protein